MIVLETQGIAQTTGLFLLLRVSLSTEIIFLLTEVWLFGVFFVVGLFCGVFLFVWVFFPRLQ